MAAPSPDIPPPDAPLVTTSGDIRTLDAPLVVASGDIRTLHAPLVTTSGDIRTLHAPLVTTSGDIRTLAFRPGEVQSEMRLSRPDRLMLAYVRAMMLFAWLAPHPRHILMVGLGGGSLAKFCHRHFPASRITVVELRADVIALREQFCVPPDDARFKVVQADACAYIAAMPANAERVDVLVVDGFDAAGLPPALVSSRFYADCWRALADDGVLVANVFSYDPQYRAMLGRLGLVFGARVARVAGVAGNNRIVFAVRASLARQQEGAAPPGLAAARLGALARLAGGRRWWGRSLCNRMLVRLVLLWLIGRSARAAPPRRQAM
ncbi:MAG: transferase spermidine synthase [Massilia sp.]|nr:transferase spermidine synthase [Massilia sp.]